MLLGVAIVALLLGLATAASDGLVGKPMFDRGQDAVFAARALTDPERTLAWHRTIFPRVDKDDRRLVLRRYKSSLSIVHR